jgi:hypothetical protein
MIFPAVVLGQRDYMSLCPRPHAACVQGLACCRLRALHLPCTERRDFFCTKLEDRSMPKIPWDEPDENKLIVLLAGLFALAALIGLHLATGR